MEATRKPRTHRTPAINNNKHDGKENNEKGLFSIDLVADAKLHLIFLKLLHQHQVSWKNQNIEKYAVSVRRYTQFWLPMISRQLKKRKSGYHHNMFVPPSDVAWIWHCHKLAPYAYMRYIKRQKLLNTCSVNDDASFESIAAPFSFQHEDYTGFGIHMCNSDGEICRETRRLWKGMFPREPFFLNDAVIGKIKSSTASDAYSEAVLLDGFDIFRSAQRKSKFLWQVSSAAFESDDFLRDAVMDYFKFLSLKRHIDNRPSTDESRPPIVIIPTNEINLIWQTHVIACAAYRNDCRSIVGKMVDHNDCFDERPDGSTLKRAIKATKHLWKGIYGSEYNMDGGMCSEEPPQEYSRSDWKPSDSYSHDRKSMVSTSNDGKPPIESINSEVGEFVDELEKNAKVNVTQFCNGPAVQQEGVIKVNFKVRKMKPSLAGSSPESPHQEGTNQSLDTMSTKDEVDEFVQELENSLPTAAAANILSNKITADGIESNEKRARKRGKILINLKVRKAKPSGLSLSGSRLSSEKTQDEENVQPVDSISTKDGLCNFVKGQENYIHADAATSNSNGSKSPMDRKRKKAIINFRWKIWRKERLQEENIQLADSKSTKDELDEFVEELQNCTTASVASTATTTGRSKRRVTTTCGGCGNKSSKKKWTQREEKARSICSNSTKDELDEFIEDIENSTIANSTTITRIASNVTSSWERAQQEVELQHNPTGSFSNKSQHEDVWIYPSGTTISGEPGFIPVKPINNANGANNNTNTTKKNYVFGDGSMGIGYYHVHTKDAYEIICKRVESQIASIQQILCILLIPPFFIMLPWACCLIPKQRKLKGVLVNMKERMEAPTPIDQFALESATFLTSKN